MGTTGNVKEEIIRKDELEKKVVKYLLEKIKIVNKLCLPYLNPINIVYEKEENIKLNETGMISYLVNILRGNRLSERKTLDVMNNIVDTINMINTIGINNISLSITNITFNENDEMIISDWYNCENVDENVNYISKIGKIFYCMMKNINIKEEEVVFEDIKSEEDIKVKLKYEKYSQLLKEMIFAKPNEVLIEEIRLEIDDKIHLESWYRSRIIKNLIKNNCKGLYYSVYHPIKNEIIQVIDNEISSYNHNKANDRMTINLNMGYLGNYGVEYLLDNIYTLKDIKYLYMKHNDIDSYGMKCLSNHFEDIPLLSCLYLNDNLVDDKSMKYFCNKCNYLTNLSDVNFSYNKIKDEGVELFVDSVSKLTKLKVIQLNNNFISRQTSLRIKIYKKCVNKSVIIKI